MAAYPDTTVLHIETGVYPASSYRMEKDNLSIYSSYRRSEETMLPVPERSTRLPTKSRVLRITLNGQSRAYPEFALHKEAVLNDSLGGMELVVVTIGGGSRAYESKGQEFSAGWSEGSSSESMMLLDENGGTWKITEDALVPTDNSEDSLGRLPSRSAFWFGWYAFYPSTEVYQLELPAP